MDISSGNPKPKTSPIMALTKDGHGSMHKAEAGAYGEALIRLELSRAHWPLVFSCQGVGIDILAVSAPPQRRRIAISVKCRDRDTKNRYETTFIFRERPGKYSADHEIQRFEEVGEWLSAEPWIAVVTIMPEFTYSHLLSLDHYKNTYATSSRNKAWNNTEKWLAIYAADPKILGNKKPGVPGIWTLPK